jgi:hypothetical protein
MSADGNFYDTCDTIKVVATGIHVHKQIAYFYNY